MKLAKDGRVFWDSRQIDESRADAPKHVQAGAESVFRVVAQTVDARGRGHAGGHGVVLLEEGDELRDASGLSGDAPADEGIRGRQIG